MSLDIFPLQQVWHVSEPEIIAPSRTCAPLSSRREATTLQAPVDTVRKALKLSHVSLTLLTPNFPTVSFGIDACRWMKHKKCSSTCWSFNSSWRGVTEGYGPGCWAFAMERTMLLRGWQQALLAFPFIEPGKFANIARIWLLQLRWASRTVIKDAQATPPQKKSSCKPTSTDH